MVIFLEIKGNNKQKRRLATFKKQKGAKHFTSSPPVISDVLGSYTGTATTNAFDSSPEDLYPVQDADDL